MRYGRDDLHEVHYTHSLMRAENAWVKQGARYDELRNYDPNGHYPPLLSHEQEQAGELGLATRVSNLLTSTYEATPRLRHAFTPRLVTD